MKIRSVQVAAQEGERKEARFEKAEALLSKALAEQGPVDLLLLPEIWATGFFCFDRYKAEAEPETGETYEFMAGWAKKMGCHVHTGSFVEKEGDHYYNTSLLLDPQGRILGKYRKIHLFGYESKENQILTSGGGITVAPTAFGRVGLCTCYDLRFPELFRAMVNLGAEFFLVTSAWPLARLAHWKLFNQVRALENQCCLISCNGTGTIGGSALGGHSMAVDPYGVVLASADETESTIDWEINPGIIPESRKAFPSLQDKRLI